MSTFRAKCIICQQKVNTEQVSNEGFCFMIGADHLWLHHECLIALLLALVYGDCPEPKKWEIPVLRNRQLEKR